MRTRARAVLAATAIALAATVGLAGCASHPTEALSKLAHVNAGELPTPAAPELPEATGTLYVPSLRLLGHYDGSAYWVGATTDDRVCFLAVTTKVDESSCVSPARFGADGATLPVGEDERIWLYLGYMTVPTDKGWRIVADNLAVR
ncbi:hypothetical protein [Cnuibacter physcomitrellae]|nr:hypothetical protein [Cnuibacter physcomitrellae]MCS5496646.1 hypothetical protein [Cnuibacter physcomitrellae]